VLRKAHRDHLQVPGIFAQVLSRNNWSPSDQRALADVVLAVPSAEAASYLIGRLDQLDGKTVPTLAEALRHAARYAPESQWPALSGFVRRRFDDQLDFQFTLFRSMDQGLQQRGASLTPALKAWGAELASRFLTSGTDSNWIQAPLNPPTESPWDYQERRRPDGQLLRVLSSLVRGEQKTGALRSPEFDLGGEIRFWLCGHDGYPDKPAKLVNGVRLKDAVSGAVLLEVRPPRSDTLVPVVWDTRAHPGKRGVIEVTDADTGDAYAWLAIGGVEGAPVLPPASPRAMAERAAGAAELAARLGLKELAPQLEAWLSRPGEPEPRAVAAKALMALDAPRGVTVASAILVDGNQSQSLRERLGVLLAERNTPESRAAVSSAFKGAAYRVQMQWALALTANRDGAETFLKASQADTRQPHYIRDTMAFMFETRLPIRVTPAALHSPQRQLDYARCWQGLRKHFDGQR
jgi:homogentisate 1,2-dioxygenase